MDSRFMEVRTAVLHPFEGEPQQVEGGVYLAPEAYLRTTAELEQLKRFREAEASGLGPALVVGAALVGLVAGFWLGRRGRGADADAGPG